MACCGSGGEEDPSSPPTLEPRHASGPRQQGYDYEFVPALDSKYECSICLLCQREPTQTTCGHRFCRDCILPWIRTERQRCPVDNSPITEADVFPDNFAKREILCLMAHCINSKNGCPAIVELGQMEDHQRTCTFQTVPCPNGCPMMLRQQDVGEHIDKECLHRVIECSLCYAKFPLNQQQAHFETCPMVSLPCPYCQANLPRQEHTHHIQEDCSQATIRCLFADIGCDAQVSRERLQEHIASGMQRHLHLLYAAHGRLHSFVFNLATMVDNECASHILDVRHLQQRLPSALTPHGADELNVGQLSLGATEPELPPSHKADDPLAEKLDPKGLCPSVIPSIPERSLLTTAEGLMKELFQRNIQLEQGHREQEIKMGTLRQRLASCETQVELLKESAAAAASECRFSNGVYVWRVPGISRLVQEARHLGHSRLVHSPGFYTGAFGYKVCLRLNVIQKDASSAFLSLFIHLMQGENDDILDWPFVGTIGLTIVHFEEDPELRNNLSETMVTKPGLAAFQRPASDRNPKGFGYTEFAAVETLVKGNYIRKDVLVVKAAVRQQECKE